MPGSNSASVGILNWARKAIVRGFWWRGGLKGGFVDRCQVSLYEKHVLCFVTAVFEICPDMLTAVAKLIL